MKESSGLSNFLAGAVESPTFSQRERGLATGRNHHEDCPNKRPNSMPNKNAETLANSVACPACLKYPFLRVATRSQMDFLSGSGNSQGPKVIYLHANSPYWIQVSKPRILKTGHRWSGILIRLKSRQSTPFSDLTEPLLESLTSLNIEFGEHNFPWKNASKGISGFLCFFLNLVGVGPVL